VRRACFHTPASRPLEPRPQRTTRVASRLTARKPASANSTTRPSSSDVGAGAVCSWWGFAIDEPLGRRPFALAFSAASEEEEPASDAPCRSAPDRSPEHCQDRFPRLFVKRDAFHGPKRLSSTSCPLGHRFRGNLERGPATVPRVLPPEAGFRRSFALRYDEEGLDPAASVSSSLTGARCHAPLVDFCNRNEPQARPTHRRNPERALAPRAFARRAIHE
jgi:hypothetical protein